MSAKASLDRPKTRQPEISDAPIEIKIPQRMVNLPAIPLKIFRNAVVLVLTVMAIVAGGFYFSF